MIGDPVISIVMPLYNKADQVYDAIMSVCSQTFEHWRLIIVDDGSTDKSVDIVLSVSDYRITLIRQRNAGVSAARNAGVKAAPSQTIAFLDADDVWEPEFLQAIVNLRRDFPDARVFATSFRYLYDNRVSRVARLRVRESFTRGFLHPYFCIASRSDPPICSSSVAVDRGAIEEVGGFPENIHSGEDLLTWAKLAAQFPIAYERRPLSVYRVSGIWRNPDISNDVGRSLQYLRSNSERTIGIEKYIAYWYCIQSGLALRSARRLMGLKFAAKAIFAYPFHWRQWYALVRSLLPIQLLMWFDKKLRGMRTSSELA